MNRSAIYVSSCMAVSALLFAPFVDQAHAACDPPRDVSSCIRVPKEIFVQASPALPQPPFLVVDPESGSTLVVTHFDPAKLAPGNNNCNPLNVQGCSSVLSTDLANRPVAKQSAPFLVRFHDGRSLLASPMN
jgi:hypothetical protein